MLNENAPLILLLQAITKLNADVDYNRAGISKLELALILYWKDDNVETLYQTIKKIRRDFRYSPSREVIEDICRREIMKDTDIIRDGNSVSGDYVDEFIRKMRLTGLISLRGGGRFIDINKNEQSKVDYVLERYCVYEKYDTEEKYFKYMSTIDENLISFESKQISVSEQNRFLEKWVGVYSWDTIKKEMLILSSRKKFSDNETLKYLSGPVRLEFLTALAIKSKFPDVKVIPNYPVDDEGVPTSTAGGIGNTGDIECFENTNGILVEVTMSEGRAQTMMEIWPISRHLAHFSKKAEGTSACYFIAPSIFSDSAKQISYVRQTEDLLIYPETIEGFLRRLENSKKLYPLA